mgnify:CR=1 FL=1
MTIREEHSTKQKEEFSKKLRETSPTNILGHNSQAFLKDRYAEIPLDKLHLSKTLPRKFTNLENLETLSRSVKAKGVIVPILVRPMEGAADDYYEIIAGQDRYKAAKKAGLQKIPCLIRPLSDRDALEYALMENHMRNALAAIDETESIIKLIAKTLNKPEKECAMLIRAVGKQQYEAGNNVIPPEWKTIQEIFVALGRNIASFRANSLPILNWPNEIKAAVRQQQISPSKAAIIARIENPEKMKAVLDQAIKEQSTVKKIRQMQAEAEGRLEKDLSPDELKKEAAFIFERMQDSDVWSCPKRKEKVTFLLRQMNRLMGGKSA